jgi:hypothetical protein
LTAGLPFPRFEPLVKLATQTIFITIKYYVRFVSMSITAFDVFVRGASIMTTKEAYEFIEAAKLRRRNEAKLLREENAELIKIIADFDTRLAEVEAQRDELQFKLRSLTL